MSSVTAQPEILAVGETMMLVAPAVAEPLESAADFHLDPGGAEANVASHLVALGRPAAWAGLVGDDALGRRLVRQLAERGVDTRWVGADPVAPTGVYFKDPGRGVQYFRQGSAASRMGPTFATTLPVERVRIVHLSGITPALSASCDAMVDALFIRAAAAGVPVSFDINHRAVLWSSRDAAARRLRDLAARSDIVFVGLDEAVALWGAEVGADAERRADDAVGPNAVAGAEPAAGARPDGAGVGLWTADDVRALLPEPTVLVVKDGAVGATEYGEAGAVHVPAVAADLVEAVGAGDAFAAGYLAAWLDGATPEARLRAGHERAVLTLADTADFPRPAVGSRLRKADA